MLTILIFIKETNFNFKMNLYFLPCFRNRYIKVHLHISLTNGIQHLQFVYAKANVQ